MNFLKGFTTNFCQALFAENTIKPKRLVGVVENVGGDHKSESQKKYEKKEAEKETEKAKETADNEARLTEVKKDLLESQKNFEATYPEADKKPRIQKTFQDLNKNLEAKSPFTKQLEAEFAAEKREALRTLIQSFGTEERKELALASTPSQLNQDYIKNMFLDQIAELVKMSPTELINYNLLYSDDFTVHTYPKNGKIKTNVGRLYCDKEDKVFVPKDKLADIEKNVKDTIKKEKEASGQKTAVEGFGEKATTREKAIATENKETAILLVGEKREEIQNRTCRLPKFLRTGLFNPLDINKWDELLKRSTPDEKTGAGRIINVLQRPSFKNPENGAQWTPNDFREVIRRCLIGGKNQLSFRELSNEIMGKNALSSGKFFKDYDALGEEAKNYEPQIKEKRKTVQSKENEFYGKIDGIAKTDNEKIFANQCRRQPNEMGPQWETRIKNLPKTIVAAQNPPVKGETEEAYNKRVAKEYKDLNEIATTALASNEMRETQILLRAQTELQTKQNDAYTKREKMETLLADASALFDAMDAMVEGTELKGQSAFEKASAENSTLEVEAAPTAETFYDYSSVVAGNPQKSAKENTKAIGINKDVVEEVKRDLAILKISDTKLNLVDSAFVLNLLNSTYGINQLVKKGYVKKTPDEKFVITMLPAQFSTDNTVFKKVVESLSIETSEDDNNGYHSRLVFNQRTAETMKLATLKDQDTTAYSKTLLDSAFVPLDDSSEMTFADAAAGNSLIYLETGLLPKRMDPGAAEKRIRNAHTSIDEKTGKATIDYEKVNQDLEFYLQMGVETYFMDPRLDIVAELAKTGVPMSKGDAEKFVATKEELINWAEKANKAKRAIGKAIKKENKEDEKTAKDEFNNCHKEIRKCKDEMLALLKGVDIKKVGDEPAAGSYLAKMNEKLQMKSGEALTDQQKLMIQNGYAVMDGLSPIVKESMRKAEILEESKSCPAVYETLTRVMKMDTHGELSSADLEEAARLIAKAIEEQSKALKPVDLKTALSKQATPNLPKDFSIGLAGAVLQTQKQGQEKQFDGMLIGTGISVPIGEKGKWSVQVGVGVGFDKKGLTQAGASTGLSRDWQVSDKVVVTTSVAGGAGVDQDKLVLGAATSTVVSVDTGMLIPAAGGALGVGYKDGIPSLGWGAMAGIRYDYREHFERRRQVGGLQAEKEFIEEEAKGDLTKKAELIAEMPEFRSVNRQLDKMVQDGLTLPPEARQAFLRDIYDFYCDEMENTGEAEAKQFPFIGVAVSYPLLVGLAFVFHGKTRVYPLAKNNFQELEKAANRDAYKDLKGATFGNPLEASIDLNKMDLAFNADGSIGALPVSTDTVMITGKDIIEKRFEKLNSAMKKGGMELTEEKAGDTAGLYRLSVYNTEEDEVEVIIDPTMKGALIAGNTPNEMYLAANMFSGNLIIQRQEFNLTRKENDSWVGYRKTVITIKSNPDKRRNANTFHREDRGGAAHVEGAKAAGKIEYRDNGKLQVDHRGNTFTLAEYKDLKTKGNLPEYLKNAFVTQEMLDAKLQATNAIIGRITERIDIQKHLDTPALANFAQNFYNNHIPLCRKATTQTIVEDKMTTYNAEMVKAIRKEYKAFSGKELDPNDSLALSFILGVIRQETYVRAPNNKEKIAAGRRNYNLFEKIAVESYGQAEANLLLANIDILNLQLGPERDIKLPRSAQVSTFVAANVVGRRNDLIGDKNLKSAVDYSNNARMRLAILHEAYKKGPQEGPGVMDTALGINVYTNYELIKGLKEKAMMDKIYDNPALATQAEYKPVYDEFVKIVKQFQAANLSTDKEEQTVAIENSMGEIQVFIDNTFVAAGVLEYCGNPSTAIDSNIRLVNVDYATRTEITQEGNYDAHTQFVGIGIAGTEVTENIPKKNEGGNPGASNDETPGSEPGTPPSDSENHGNTPGHP